MSSYETGVAGSFMRRSASATSSSGLASAPVQPISPSHKMEPVSKPQPRGMSPFPVPYKGQLPPRVHYPSHLNSGSSRGSCKWNVWIFAGILSFLLVSLYAFSLTGGVQYAHFKRMSNRGYGIIIDAGSSGSRLHVFQYIDEGHLPHIDPRYSVSKKVTPGLSSFASNLIPEAAGQSLIELVNFAKEKIPSKNWASTRVYLMATAGLRLVEPATQERILDSCRAVLRRSGFFFREDWASVISGSDEGIYAWVAANYVLGTLGHDPQETIGIVELGGASAQVTFIPDVRPPPEYLQTLDLGGVTYTLYTYSFLRLGQEAAWKALFQSLYSGAVKPSLPTIEDGVVVDPCTPKGYVRSQNGDEIGKGSLLPSPISGILSAGNFSECHKAALSLLQQGRANCLHKQCAIGSNFVPNLRGKFFGTENFFYTSQFFGLLPNATLAEIRSSGEQYCEKDWSALQEEHSQISKEDLLKYCFSTSYIVALLHDSLGISMQDDRIKFTNQVGSLPLDWALGALIVRIGEDSLHQPTAGLLGDEVFSVLSLMGSLFIVGFGLWFVMRWRKPHLKTIYDLEKGRYITSAARVHR